MLKEKTQLLAEELKMEDFKCSASWIMSFRQRHNIVFGQMAGEGKMAGQSRHSFTMIAHDFTKVYEAVWPGHCREFSNDKIF